MKISIEQDYSSFIDLKSSDHFCQFFAEKLNVTPDNIKKCIIDFKSESLYSKLIDYEYGLQGQLIPEIEKNNVDIFIPTVASLASIVVKFKRNMVIVCDILSLNFIHKGNRIIKLQSELSVNADLIISYSNYHYSNLNLDQNNKENWNYIKNSLALNSKVTVISIEEMNNWVMAKPKRKATNTHHLSVKKTKTISESNTDSSASISEYVNKYMTKDSDGYKLANDAYSNNTFVDVLKSDYRIENEVDILMKPTFDIDAILILFTADQFINTMRCGGSIHKSKDYSMNSQEQSKLKHLVENSKLPLKSCLQMVKIGELESFGKFELFVISGSTDPSSTDSYNLKQEVKHAMNQAEKLHCDKCPFNLEHRSVRNGRPNNSDQIIVNNFRYEYDFENLRCFISQMIRHLESRIPKDSGQHLYLHARAIGTKFKIISADLNTLNETLLNYLSVFKIESLLGPSAPTTFIDFAMLIAATDPNNELKVYCVLFIIIINHL